MGMSTDLSPPFWQGRRDSLCGIYAVINAFAYGVSLYRIADDQDIASFTSRDPVVMNGAGHYEHHPMLQGLH